MGWDDNGLNVERRVQLLTGTIVDPTLPYDPDFRRPEKVDPKARALPISRPNFIELCEEVVPEFEAAYHDLWATVGLSVDWEHTYTTIGTKAVRTSQRGFLRLVQRDLAYRSESPTLWDVDMRTAVAQAELTDKELPGAYHKLVFDGPDRSAADRHDAPRAAARVRGRRRPPRRRALPAAVRAARHHAAVRRVGADRRPRARRSREGHRRGDDLHLRRHHGRHVVARAVVAGACHRAARRPAAADHLGRARVGGHRPRRPRRPPTTSWPARRSSRRRPASSSCSPRPDGSTATSARSPTP